METELKYIGECKCLTCSDIESNDCLKRFFTVKDLENNKSIRVAFCSDYLRLLVHRECVLNDRSYYWTSLSVIEIQIKNFLGYKDEPTDYLYKKFLACPIIFPVCESPFIGRYITLKTAMNLYLNGNYSLHKQIKNSVNEWLVRNNRYKKYKLIETKLTALLKKLEYAYGERAEIVINEILTLSLTLNSKTK